MLTEKTIAAIATARGSGGVSIIRVSGSDSIKICSKVLRGRKPLDESTSYMLNYGKVVDEYGNTVDRVLYVLMRAPHSFTGEDVVEIHAHGGVFNTDKILSLIIKSGASLAGRGEFTKRAFLNGKIDLAQAESVLDIISAKSETSLYGAAHTLEGKISKEIREMRDNLLSLAAQVSVAADYPEEDIDFCSQEKIRTMLCDAITKTDKMTQSAQRGKIIRDGFCCAIVGRPNTGKSSLLNALVGEKRAIVTGEAGTTRDIVEECIEIDGVTVRLGDTAGIRKAAGEAEQIGIDMAREYIENADMCIMVVDGSSILPDDEDIYNEISDKPHIIAVNKCDIKRADFHGGIPVSAKTGFGIDALCTLLVGCAVGDEKITAADSKKIINLRQIEAAIKGMRALESAVKTISDGFPPDLVLNDIEDAIEAFGRITGQSVSDEIVDTIFSKFCLGK